MRESDAGVGGRLLAGGGGVALQLEASSLLDLRDAELAALDVDGK